MKRKMSNYKYNFFHLVIGLISVSACIEDTALENQQQASDMTMASYFNANNITATAISDGIFYESLVKNDTGQTPKIGEVMNINYDIKTLEGIVLESSTDSSTLFRFNTNRIIPNGINYGISIMKKGETIRLYIPSYHAYSNYVPDQKEFGANANFIISLSLLDIKDEDQLYKEELDLIRAHIDATSSIDEVVLSSSGLYYRTIEAGNGSLVKPYNQVKLHYTRKYLDGSIIAQTPTNTPIETIIQNEQLVAGFSEGVLRMTKGEKALLIMPSRLAFGASVQILPQFLREELYRGGYITNLVRPYSPVMYEVELLDIK